MNSELAIDSEEAATDNSVIKLRWRKDLYFFEICLN